jgi:hypothetical protein
MPQRPRDGAKPRRETGAKGHVESRPPFAGDGLLQNVGDGTASKIDRDAGRDREDLSKMDQRALSPHDNGVHRGKAEKTRQPRDERPLLTRAVDGRGREAQKIKDTVFVGQPVRANRQDKKRGRNQKPAYEKHAAT